MNIPWRTQDEIEIRLPRTKKAMARLERCIHGIVMCRCDDRSFVSMSGWPEGSSWRSTIRFGPADPNVVAPADFDTMFAALEPFEMIDPVYAEVKPTVTYK